MKGAGLSVADLKMLFHVMQINFLVTKMMASLFRKKCIYLQQATRGAGWLCWHLFFLSPQFCIISLHNWWHQHVYMLWRLFCCTFEAWRRAAFQVQPHMCEENSVPASSRRSHAGFAPTSQATPAVSLTACAHGSHSCSVFHPRWSTHWSQGAAPDQERNQSHTLQLYFVILKKSTTIL